MDVMGMPRNQWAEFEIWLKENPEHAAELDIIRAHSWMRVSSRSVATTVMIKCRFVCRMAA